MALRPLLCSHNDTINVFLLSCSFTGAPAAASSHPPFLSVHLELPPCEISSSAFVFIKAEGYITRRDKSESSLYNPLPVAKERHRRRVFDLIKSLLVIYPILLTTVTKTSRESTTPIHDVFHVEHQATAAHGCLATACQVRRYYTTTPIFEHQAFSNGCRLSASWQSWLRIITPQQRMGHTT
jgi:hypothetical protein